MESAGEAVPGQGEARAAGGGTHCPRCPRSPPAPRKAERWSRSTVKKIY